MTTPNLPLITRIVRRLQGVAFIPCTHRLCGREARYWHHTGETCTHHTPKARRHPMNRLFPYGLPARDSISYDHLPF